MSWMIRASAWIVRKPCSSTRYSTASLVAVALVWRTICVRQKTPLRTSLVPRGAFIRCSIVALAVASSLSSGAYLALMWQIGLIAWDLVTQKTPHRWLILAGIILSGVVAVDMISNRNVFEVIISYLTMDPDNGYIRIVIWQYGLQNVYAHPLFGLGFHDWQRPDWLGPSTDNFWLTIAMQHGFPQVTMLIVAIFSVLRRLGKVKDKDAAVLKLRNGLVIAIIGFALAACTVALWNAAYSLFMFLIGSGVWMLNETKAASGAAAPLPVGPASRRDS